MLAAIKTIKDQGGGTANSPDSPEFGSELAHHYRFGETRYGKKFVEVDGSWKLELRRRPGPVSGLLSRLQGAPGWVSRSAGVKKF